MKMTKMKKHLSLCLCIVLIAATALFTNGCSDKQNAESADTAVESTNSVQEVSVQDTAASDTSASDVSILGEGKTTFSFTVTDQTGNETQFEIYTDQANVGEALLELGLIAGDEGDYGLYVKEVNGITADYDTDGTYWAFYVDGEYAMSGVGSTEITEGSSYAFKVEK